MSEFKLKPDLPLEERDRKREAMLARLRKEHETRRQLVTGTVQARGFNALTVADLKWAVAYYALKPKQGKMLAFAREELAKRETPIR